MSLKIRKERAIRHDYVIRSIHDEEVEPMSYLFSEKEYDEQGHVIREISFDSSGEVQEHLCYRYDNQGRMLEMRSYYDVEEDSLIESVTYTYQDGGHPISAVKGYADGSEDQISYSYNDAGQLIRKEVLNDEGEEEELEQWRYKDGREVWYERREYGEAVFREEQEYDEQGNVTVITLWEAETDNTIMHKIYYDEEGRRNRIEKFNDQGKLVSVIEIPLFENGEPLEMIENTSGAIRTHKYQYDESGNLVNHQEFGPGGQVITEVVKTYDPDRRLLSTEVTNDRQGMGMNQRYRIEYEYIEEVEGV